MTATTPLLASSQAADTVADLGPGVLGMVAGFLIDPTTGSVLLVRKNRPDWMAGKLNGIGGKIEPGETPAQAMRREFAEEACLDVGTWQHFLTLTLPAGMVWFFRSFADLEVLGSAVAGTDEPIECWPVTDLSGPGALTLPNLAWILPLAAYRHDSYAPVLAAETPAQP